MGQWLDTSILEATFSHVARDSKLLPFEASPDARTLYRQRLGAKCMKCIGQVGQVLNGLDMY